MISSLNKMTFKMVKVLICGHIDLSEEDFCKYYMPCITKYSVQYDDFYVGGARGVDTYAQKFLKKENAWTVTICDKGDQNNNLYPEEFRHINGFSSYIERDGFMTDIVSDIIVYLRKHYMSIGSGSFCNVVRLFTNKTTANNFMEYARSCKYDNSVPLDTYFDQVIENFSEFSEEMKLFLKEKVRDIMII